MHSLQVATDLLHSDKHKVAISQLCNEQRVCNFTMLYLTQK